jgi:hypothetical protein
MADVIPFGDYADLKPVDQADNFARAFNAAWAMMEALSREERLLFISRLQAADACEYGGRNACHGNALRRAGEGFALSVWEINKTFPPPGEEPFR